MFRATATRAVLVAAIGFGAALIFNAGLVLAQANFLSAEGFHISALLEQPLTSRDWGFFGNRSAPGLDIVGDIQWRFIPASNDTYEAPAAILTEQGNLSLKGSLDAQTLTLQGNATIQGTLTVNTFQIQGTLSPTTLTIGPNQEASLYVATDTSQKGSPAIIYHPPSGTWMLRNNQGFFSEITTESTDTVGGGGGGGAALTAGNDIDISIANAIDLQPVLDSVTTINAAPLTINGNVNLATGELQTNGTTRLTNAGILQNVTANTGILTSGTLGVARGGTGLGAIAQGGILYASAAETLSRIAPTAANQIVRSTGANALEIAALVAADIPNLDTSILTTGALATARGGTGLGTFTAGGRLLYSADAATLAALPIGALDTVLTSSGAVPQWSTALNLSGNITAATVNATTGINTGAGAGTQRIDSSGHGAFGSSAVVSATEILKLQETATAGTFRGISSLPWHDTSAGGGALVGVFSQPVYTGAANSLTDLVAFDAQVVLFGGAIAPSNSYGLRVQPIGDIGGLDPAAAYGIRVQNQGLAGTANVYGLYLDSITAGTNQYAIYQAGADDWNALLGLTGLGRVLTGNDTSYRLVVQGAVCVDDGTANCPAAPTAGGIYVENSVGTGNVSAFDIAETYNAAEPVDHGELVVVAKDGRVRRTASTYEGAMLGIVSTSPAIVFDDDAITFGKTAGTNFDPLKPYVALAGRVPAKVSAENGPIAHGDPITSSSQPGMGMKANRSGRIVGIALESFECEVSETQCEGTILVFVNPTWYLVPDLAGHASETDAEGLFGRLLANLGGTFRDGALNLARLVVRHLAAEEAVFNKATVDQATIRRLQLIDEGTGDIYCTCIENGEWRKSKGACLAN